MRNTASRRPRSQSPFSFLWIIAIVLIIGILLVLKFLYPNHEHTTKEKSTIAMNITPLDEKSFVFISEDASAKTRITSPQKLYTSDAFVSVDEGGALGDTESIHLDIDKGGELHFESSSSTGDVFILKRGRIWAEGKGAGALIEMENARVQIAPDTIAFLEQKEVGSVFNTLYAIKGDIDIITNIGRYTLKSGNKIKIDSGNIANKGEKLSELASPIDEGITKEPLFTRNNGETYLKNKPEESSEGSGALTEETTSGSIQKKYITISQPTDGMTLKTDKVTIMGTLGDPSVTRITFNDIDASVSPVNQTFVFQDFGLSAEINNIVYKVYDGASTLLEKGVFVIYGPKTPGNSTTLVPTNYPISNKDFSITSPNKNPFATNESYVMVKGNVPANVVQYIIVNDYRLQKFVPNSTTWYYHANLDMGTMKEGMNLYNIKFYDAKDTLLYTQLFTIIKDDKKNTGTPAAL